MRKLSWREVALDAALIFFGSLLFAFGLDCFEIPNGLAAGGITGLATVFHALALQVGVNLPVGIQSIVMNVLLFAYVVKSGSRRYAVLTAAGIIVSGVLTDVIVPLVPILGEGDLLLCALWGGVITGVGLGMVFRTGGNTGGTDIIAQLIARKTGASVGSMAIVVDGAIVALSAPVFSMLLFIPGNSITSFFDFGRTRFCWADSCHFTSHRLYPFCNRPYQDHTLCMY